MPTTQIPKPGDVVTGEKYAGRSTARVTVTVTAVHADLGLVHGRLHYAGTRRPGDRYEGCYRGLTSLALGTVEPA